MYCILLMSKLWPHLYLTRESRTWLYLQSKCFFLGPMSSSVVALQTAFASPWPARECLAARIRSLIVWPLSEPWAAMTMIWYDRCHQLILSTISITTYFTAKSKKKLQKEHLFIFFQGLVRLSDPPSSQFLKQTFRPSWSQTLPFRSSTHNDVEIIIVLDETSWES